MVRGGVSGLGLQDRAVDLRGEIELPGELQFHRPGAFRIGCRGIRELQGICLCHELVTSAPEA